MNILDYNMFYIIFRIGYYAYTPFEIFIYIERIWYFELYISDYNILNP